MPTSHWIVVVGGTVVYDNSCGFRTSNYGDHTYCPDNPSPIVGCSCRGEAAAKLWRQDQDAKVIVLGGITPFHQKEAEIKGFAPNICSATTFQTPLLDKIIALELETLGVPKDNITTVDLIAPNGVLLGTTHQQLLHLLRLAEDAHPEEITIISNFWQVRLAAMALRAPGLGPECAISPTQPGVTYDFAERILGIDRDELLKLPAAQQLCSNEAWGFGLVMSHTYKFGTMPQAGPTPGA
ncbi:MAG: hypothetical protein WCT37_01340 [Patescibacteria group bacterium]|jgi:hypothetical protein